MDIIQLNLQQRLLENQAYDENFKEKPVFAYWGSNTGAQAMLSYYSAGDKHPRKTLMLGGGNVNADNMNGLANSFNQSEVSNASYSWSGNSSAPSSSGINPSSGRVGCQQFSDTFSLANVDATENGPEFSYYAENNNQNAMSAGGVVIGEEGYVRGLTIGCTGNARFYACKAGHDRMALLSDYFSMSNVAGFTAASAYPNNGEGCIAYNRVTNTVIFIETYMNGSGFTAHFFKDLPEKIKPNSTHFKQMLEKATAGADGASYETFDFTWSGANNEEWNKGCRIIPCDDGSVWLVKKYSSSALRLGRITGPSSRAFSTVATLSTTTSYGREQSLFYGARDMASDDGKMIAVYTTYYYYLCGFVGYFLPRDSAVDATRFKSYRNTDSAYGYTIAPFKNSDFIIGYGNNSDSRTADGEIIPLTDVVLNTGAAAITSTGWRMVSTPIYGGSTSYGGTGFMKVKPNYNKTTEYGEE